MTLKTWLGCLLVLLGLPGVPPRAADDSHLVNELIRDGIRLHDDGKYDQAIARYKEALGLDPDNTAAMYELANTCAVTGDYDQAIAWSRKALAGDPGGLEPQLYSMWGSGLSCQGKSDEALAIFRKGLERYPDNVALNYNITVTLDAKGQTDEAITHIKTAIAGKPTYASAVAALTQLLVKKNWRVPSLLFCLRFCMIEPNSNRTVTFAHEAETLLNSCVERKGDKDVNIMVNLDPTTEGDFSTLDTALSLAAAGMFLKEESRKSPAERFVGAMTSFTLMLGELKYQSLAGTFTWQQAAIPLLKLEKKHVLEPFMYFVAVRAELEGAVDWLKNHPEQLKSLNTVLSDLGSR